MWDLPGPGLEPVSPASAGRFSTRWILPCATREVPKSFFKCATQTTSLELCLIFLSSSAILLAYLTFKFPLESDHFSWPPLLLPWSEAAHFPTLVIAMVSMFQPLPFPNPLLFSTQQPERSFLKFVSRDFPGGPVAKVPCSQCRGSGFHPWSGN